MVAGVWLWDNGGDEFARYDPYSEEDSQLLEDNFNTSGFKAITKLSLGGSNLGVTHIVRKTRKGWVQEVDGHPELWRAVKRVQQDGGTPPQTAAAAATPPPSPHGMAPTTAASPNFELLQLRDEREARQRAAASSAATSPAVASSPAASPPSSATHQPLLLPLPMQQQRLHESNTVHTFRLCTVRTLPPHAAPCAPSPPPPISQPSFRLVSPALLRRCAPPPTRSSAARRARMVRSAPLY